MTATAPAPPAGAAYAASRWQRVRGPAVVLGGLGLATLALHLRDPHQSGSWGYCPSALLGVYCPGCGGLRAVNDLTHGDVVAAASSNLLFVGSLPFLAVWWGRRTVDGWRGVRRHVDERRALVVTYAVIGAAVAFWVVRNLPFAGWLTP
jgi:hypothetical protein